MAERERLRQSDRTTERQRGREAEAEEEAEAEAEAEVEAEAEADSPDLLELNAPRHCLYSPSGARGRDPTVGEREEQPFECI